MSDLRAAAHVQNHGLAVFHFEKFRTDFRQALEAYTHSFGPLDKIKSSAQSLRRSCDELAGSPHPAYVDAVRNDVNEIFDDVERYLAFAQQVRDNPQQVGQRLGIELSEAAVFDRRVRQIPKMFAGSRVKERKAQEELGVQADLLTRAAKLPEAVPPSVHFESLESDATTFAQPALVDALITDLALKRLAAAIGPLDELDDASLSEAIVSDPTQMLALVLGNRNYEGFFQHAIELIERGKRVADEMKDDADRASNWVNELTDEIPGALRLSHELHDVFDRAFNGTDQFGEVIKSVVARSDYDTFYAVLAERRGPIGATSQMTFEALGELRQKLDPWQAECHRRQKRAEDIALPAARTINSIVEANEHIYGTLRGGQEAVETFEYHAESAVEIRAQQILRAEQVRMHSEQFPAIVTQFGAEEPEDPTQRVAWNDAVGRAALLGNLIGFGNTTLFNVPKTKSPSQQDFFIEEVARLTNDARILGFEPRIVAYAPAQAWDPFGRE